MTDIDNSLPKAQVIEGSKHSWELVVGMEVHAQIKSKAKLFSSASTNFGSEPNSNVSIVDAAMPGMLPVLNMFCIEQAVKTGLGLKAEINLFSQFDRKNYFYPDHRVIKLVNSIILLLVEVKLLLISKIRLEILG